MGQAREGPAAKQSECGGYDSWTSARLFALLNMSLADGYIASFSVKYGDPFWRPVTAIREQQRQPGDHG